MSSESLPDIGTIHERLAYARRRAELTQVQLAKKLGIGVRTLQSYESGETKVPAELVPKVERIADIPPGWILYDGSGDDWKNDTRRLPPGSSGLLSILFSVATLAFSGVGSETAAVAPCHCYAPAGARQPRLKLARSSHVGRTRKGMTK